MGSAGENIPSESHTMPTWIAIWDEKNSERFAPHGSVFSNPEMSLNEGQRV